MIIFIDLSLKSCRKGKVEGTWVVQLVTSYSSPVSNKNMEFFRKDSAAHST